MYINNLREKFSPGPGFEPGSPALRAGAITTKPPRRSTGPSRNPIREEVLLGPVDRLGGLVVIAPARRAGDPGSNPGPGENFFLKLLILVDVRF